MARTGSDAAWERYGEVDPYFAVVSHDRFRRENLDDAAVAEFFRSGQTYIDWLLRTVRTRVDPDFTPHRVLDFGCGVGRLLIPFARISHHVVGVDVSEGMLHEARKNCRSQGLRNVDVTRSDDRLERVDGTFNFVHSWIVFQHIPPRRGLAILREILGRLDDDGVGALHFTYHSTAPRSQRARAWLRARLPPLNALVNLARGRPPSYPAMQMNSYDMNRVVAVLQRAGCEALYGHLTDHAGHLGAILFFRKRPVEAGYRP